MNRKNELVLFESKDGNVALDVNVSKETVWLTQNQMMLLFGRDQSVISRHINSVFRENEVSEESNMQILHIPNSDKPVKCYSLDVIISVGYRVKSSRGVEFRRWANKVLKEYILNGYALNRTRLEQLSRVVEIMKRTESQLDAKQVLSVVEQYTTALDLLDDYDHHLLTKPDGSKGDYVLTYEECCELIAQMRFGSQSELFGREKDDSFKGCIGNIYQSAFGVPAYPSIEEKAANLLYFVTKDHSFLDGNKRIAAAVFLYFLEKNGILFRNGEKRLADHTLVAIIIMIAESKPEEKETMIKLVMNFLV